MYLDELKAGDKVLIDTVGNYHDKSRFVRGTVSRITKKTVCVRPLYTDGMLGLLEYKYYKATGVMYGSSRQAYPQRISAVLNKGQRLDTWADRDAWLAELEEQKEKEEKIACVKRNIQQLTNEQLGVICGWLTDKYKES